LSQKSTNERKSGGEICRVPRGRAEGAKSDLRAQGSTIGGKRTQLIPRSGGGAQVVGGTSKRTRVKNLNPRNAQHGKRGIGKKGGGGHWRARKRTSPDEDRSRRHKGYGN